VGETVELTDVALRIIGAFYAFGAFAATRAGLMSQFIDQAIAAIALKKPTRDRDGAERLADRCRRQSLDPGVILGLVPRMTVGRPAA
jgi:hypothetical protein